MKGWIITREGIPMLEDDGYIVVFMNKERALRRAPANTLVCPVMLEVVSEKHLTTIFGEDVTVQDSEVKK